MSLENCVIKAKQWLDENKDIKVSAGRLYQFARLLNEAGGDSLTPDEVTSKMQEAIKNFGERELMKNQVELAHNLLVREGLVQSTLNNTEKWKQDISEGKKWAFDSAPAIEAFRAAIQGGSLRPGESSNLSISKMSGALERRFLSTLERSLGENKDTFSSGRLDKQIIQELHALDNGLTLEQSGDKQALAIAKAIKETRDDIFSKKQAINPHLEAAQDFLVERNHNREKITAAGKEEWIQAAMEAYGKKSFPGNTPEEKLAGFSDIYDRIAAGVFGSIEDKFSDKNYYGVLGEGGDLMRRMAKGRILIADDWQSEYKYMSKFGDDSLYQTMQKSIKSGANDIAKLTKWGSKQRETYEQTFNQIRKRLPDEDRAEFEQFKTRAGGFDDMFDVSMGSQTAPARNRRANAAQGLMAIQTMAKSGMHLIRSMPDIQNAVSLTRDMFGRSLIQNASEMTAQFAKNMAFASDAKERMGDLGLLCRSIHQEMMRGIGGGDTAPGFMAKGAELAGKIGLADRQQNAIKAGVGTLFSKQFAELSGKYFGDLPQVTKNGISRYGIGEHEWEFIRHATQDIPFGENESRSMMTPEAIEKLEDDRAEIYLRKTGQYTGEGTPSKRILDNARFQNSLKYSTMINEIADLSAANGDLRQRTWLYGNTDVNSGIGMVRRLASQFKQAGLVSNDVMRRAYYGGDGLKGAYAGLAQHMAMSLFLFTVSDMAHQFASGKTPEDPTNPEYIGKMAIGSGGAGLFGDALIEALNGKTVDDKFIDLAKSAAGPGLSAVGQGAAISLQALQAGYKDMNGKPSKYPGKQAVSLAAGNIPFQNLFYTKSALNYYLINGLKEFMGHGYLGALERQTHQTPALGGGNQTYWYGKPTGNSFFSGE